MADEDDDFAIDIPECPPGTTLKMTAPDGCPLQIPLPGHVRPGDQLVMRRKPEGGWAFARHIRHVEENGGPPSTYADHTGPPTHMPALDDRWTGPWRSQEALSADLAGPGVVTVRLETTKGTIEMRVVPRWAPRGVRRLLRLVDDGYYEDVAVYRAIRGGLVQFGLVADDDPRSGQYPKLEDDPLVGIPYQDGAVSFAAAGPGSRTATLCIMLADFSDQLGRSQPETVMGFVRPEFMKTLRSLFTGYGDIPQQGGQGPDPAKLTAYGNQYVRDFFPQCDFVKSADRFYDPRFV